jgi:hypothetical protein
MTRKLGYSVEYNRAYESRGLPWMLRKYAASGDNPPLAHYASEDEAHREGKLWNTTEEDGQVSEDMAPLEEAVTRLEEKVAQMGDNQPPEPINQAYEDARVEVEELYDQMKDWLDGEPVTNQAQANDLSRLIDKMRKAKKRAEDAKGEEKRPHLDANIAIEARYKPLVSKAETAVKVALRVQGDYLNEQDRIQRELAQRVAAEARAAAEAAAAAAQAATVAGNLSAREDAEEQIDAAASLVAEAKMLSGLKANAKGEDMTRAVGLVTTYTPIMIDGPAALRHYWTHPNPNYRKQIEELAIKFAGADVRGGARAIPGFRIDEEKVAR